MDATDLAAVLNALRSSDPPHRDTDPAVRLVWAIVNDAEETCLPRHGLVTPGQVTKALRHLRAEGDQ